MLRRAVLQGKIRDEWAPVEVVEVLLHLLDGLLQRTVELLTHLGHALHRRLSGAGGGALGEGSLGGGAGGPLDGRDVCLRYCCGRCRFR